MLSPSDSKRKRASSSPLTRPAAARHVSSAASSSHAGPHYKRRKQHWVRLLLRELYDLDYKDAAAALEREAGVQLRSRPMKTLQELVTRHEWDQAVQLVTKQGGIENNVETKVGAQTKVEDDEILDMKSPVAAREALLLLLQRKFIDFLLAGQLPLALRTFQDEILPRCEPNEAEVTRLAELLLCKDADEMQQKVAIRWQDEELQQQIDELVSAEEMIPEGALRKLVQDGYNMDPDESLMTLSGRVGGECVALLSSSSKVDVWELAFSPDGDVLAAASSDGSIVLWQISWVDEGTSCHSKTPLCVSETLHVLQSLDGSADCLAWSPDSQFLLSSGSRSWTIQLWNRQSGLCEKRFQHPGKVVTKIHWLPRVNQFVSGSADKSLILWDANKGSIIHKWSDQRVLDIAVHPFDTRVYVLISGYEIRVYDVARKSDELFLHAKHLISCLSISPSGEFLLVNYIKQEKIACVEIATGSIIARYRGIREQRYVLRPCFSGAHGELVACGSEDSIIYLWQKVNGKQVGELDGHSSVVNVVVRHPLRSNVIASASDDKTVRLWSLKSLE
uniref:Uncharacterized protein n=1 Tax=Peronospora matthiolae TaxID=2874970 RepID=A0AAV1UHQ3_9STRA